MPKSKLTKRKDGRFRKVVNGVAFYGYTEREIDKKILEYKEKKALGPTFAEVADEWWKIEVEHLAPTTARIYRTAARRAVEFFGKRYIKDISTSDVTRYLHHLGRMDYAKQTVANHKIAISRILHYAVVECYIPFNPAREAEIPRGLSEMPRKPATKEEEQKILECANVWLMPYMALLTGMRKGELRGLQWGDIDLDKGLIYVRRSVWDEGGPQIKTPKTEAGTRKIPIMEPLKRELERHRGEPNKFVFGDDKPISLGQFKVMFDKFKKQTGITATMHQLRKSYATMAVGANIPADVLKSIFGHKDISTTLNIYAEVREDRIKEAGQKMSDPFLTLNKL